MQGHSGVTETNSRTGEWQMSTDVVRQKTKKAVMKDY